MNALNLKSLKVPKSFVFRWCWDSSMWCERDNSSDYSCVVLGKLVLFQLFGSCLQSDYILHDDPERATGADISCNYRPGSKM